MYTCKTQSILLSIITTLRTESNMACIVTVSIKVDALFNQVLTTVPIKWNLWNLRAFAVNDTSNKEP